MQATEPDSKYLRRFLAYALSYKGLLAVAIGMGLLKFMSNFSFPWLIGTALDHVVSPRPSLHLNESQRLAWLIKLAGIGVFFSVLHAIGTYGRGYFSSKLGNRVIADLRQDLFDHLHRLSLHFYSKERTGSIVSRLINDIQQASQLINGGMVSVVMDLSNLFVGIFLLMGISWKLGIACVAVMPFYAITFRLLNPHVRNASLRVQSQISLISGNVQERLAGIALVKTYAAEWRERKKFVEDTEEHFERVLEQSNLSQCVNAISEFLVHIGTTLVIAVGGYLALKGDPTMTAGQVTKALGYLAVMYLPVRRFAEVNNVYQTSLGAIERVFQVFDITPKITEQPSAVKISPARGHVVFENVCFDYQDESDETRVSLEDEAPDVRALRRLEKSASLRRETALRNQASRQGEPMVVELAAKREEVAVPRRWIIDHLSLDAQPGERIALVGPSGSGKTTLLSLLPRLYDVSEGRIFIDGVDVRDYRLKALRRGIGIVQQDSFLFSGTVRENIAYGRPRASDEEIRAAAEAANAHEFIESLPDGYHARLGERGVNLSGGQRQRLNIARAILKDPRILILDEATSALDSESEALVQEALERVMKNRTCFIIAHRLSTVRHADRILVMRGGRIIETGRHDALVEQNGLYARLVRQQFGLANPEIAETPEPLVGAPAR